MIRIRSALRWPSRRLAALAAGARRTGTWLTRHRAALLAALALGAGWALLTWGVASLLVWQVWPISAGLLCVSLFGWRLFGLVALEGLYSLTRERRG